MSTILLPIQWNGLPEGQCFQTLDAMGLAFANAMQAVLANGRSYYNIGDTKPDPSLQAYPWYNTAQGRWFIFQGVWRAPNNYDGNERRWWSGSLDQLVTYDGGSAGTVTPTTGPMWVEDTTMQGRIPMGPGAIPDQTPTKTLGIGEQYGAGSHTLTKAEGAVADNVFPIGLSVPGNDDVFLNNAGLQSTTTWNRYFVTGDGTPQPGTENTADLFTLPANNGAGVTASPFNTIPPVVGLYCIKPSGRQFYVVL